MSNSYSYHEKQVQAHQRMKEKRRRGDEETHPRQARKKGVHHWAWSHTKVRHLKASPTSKSRLGDFPRVTVSKNVLLMTHLKAQETRHSEPFREERTGVGVRHGSQSIDVRLRLRFLWIIRSIASEPTSAFPWERRPYVTIYYWCQGGV